MVAPDTWSAPAAQGSASACQPAHVSYLNGHWVAVTRPTSSAAPHVRYATDPTGTWSNGSAITNPSGSTSGYLSAPYFDGTYYGFFFDGIQTSPTRRAIYSAYTTDLSTAWTVGTVTTVERLLQYGGYLNGEWVVAGYDVPANTGYVGTGASISGSFSFDTSSHGLASGEQVLNLDHDGSHYIMGGGVSVSSTYWRYSTALTGSWTAISALNSAGFNTLNGMVRMWHPTQGYWMPIIYSTGTRQKFAQAATDTTWGTLNGYLDSTTIQIDNVYDVAANGAYWVAVGQEGSSSRLSYFESTGSPDGTWTSITGGFSGSQIFAVGWGDDYFVGVDVNGNIRYAYSPAPPAVTTGPTLLRQRQSPRRSPSRVGYPALRARQTPYIT